MARLTASERRKHFGREPSLPEGERRGLVRIWPEHVNAYRV